ncbi:MAG: bifunctional UDP-N-acetylglucosamine diphosphorylase/glucosamine-1-phosphate N-acetyltransferase GlmU [Actinomycetota bacterium]
MSVEVIVLAAGKGTRMRSETAKVLHEAAGRTLLDWVLNASRSLDPVASTVVVGHQAEAVAATLSNDVTSVIQDPQHGTGHAVQVGMEGLADHSGTIVVLPGDMPLMTGHALVDLVAHHEETGAVATVMTVVLDDPTGYGRIVRGDTGVESIVEDRDATPDQKTITEVNTSVYVFDGRHLGDALESITPDNSQGEYYLTDVVAFFVAGGQTVSALSVPAEMGIGVNTHAQLAEVAAVLRGRINADLLDSGVWMLDPSRVYIDAGVAVDPTARVYPEVYLTGTTSIGPGAVVGPNVQAHSSEIGRDAIVKQAVMVDSIVGREALVGPFAYLRPGAVLGRGAKAGTYVEIKGSVVGAGSKVPHLSYIGDATVGENSNIGAGTITVNYDGYEKHSTTIGDRVRIGSDTMLVAPVDVGNDAVTGAGSVITDDVPEGALGVSRDPQRNVDGYAEKRRKRAEKESG